jgi:hypothetical protein
MGAIDVFIGERTEDHIRIRVMSRTDQVIRDYWDANWLATVVSVNLGGWKGTNEKAYFRTEEFSHFRELIERLADGSLSEAAFAPMEPHLRLEMTTEPGTGPVRISGTSIDRLDDGNVLTFRMTVDRAALPRLAAQLKSVEASYPTIGKQ